MSEPAALRFGAFELNSISGELRRQGDLVKLAPQPLRVLDLLARRSGEVVTRNEIRDHVWSGDTFVDFEQGLNFCIRQIREVLGDTADAPRFIETLPRRGYRFLMPVKSGLAHPEHVTRLMVLPFRPLRPDPETDFLAFSLPDAVTASLGGLKSLVVRSSMAASRFASDAADPKKIAAEADVDVIVSGTLLRAGDEVRVTTQLTDAVSGTLLWSHTAQAAIGDLFSVQDQLTHAIVTSLSLPLTSREQQMLKRDVPASAVAYEYFLRGNQLSYDSKQWAVARDLYLRSVEEDPRFAPAWARLGRIHHVMGKYLDTGTAESLDRAEEAFRRALELNPDLSITHKLYAQLDVDRGRVRDAMARLIERAHTADPELLAGLVTTCRYCGLLDASTAAHKRALSLEPKIRTSVPHTWYFQRDYARVVTIKPIDFPYIVPLSMAESGRKADAIATLRELEQKIQTRVRELVSAARWMLEGDSAQSVAAVNRFLSPDFRDPEGLFYAARHLARLKEDSAALGLLERVVAGGFFCFPAIASDPWLDPLRKKAAFAKLLRQAETEHQHAATAFTQLGGDKVLGLGLSSASLAPAGQSGVKPA
jgi:DNA-binding winged helix-turn-helix (wHTH) protein/tetratricopeptide (TPR) repeat protein